MVLLPRIALFTTMIAESSGQWVTWIGESNPTTASITHL